MASAQQRDDIGALTTSVAGREALPDRESIKAARINGAETRAEAQTDEMIASICRRVYGDAARLPEPSGRIRTECGSRTSGSVGAAGIRWSNVCQSCKDLADGQLARRLHHTAKLVDKLAGAMRKPKPAVIVDGLQLVCSCGGVEFTEIAPSAAEPEVNWPGDSGGYECDHCGKRIEHEALDRDD